MILYVSNLFVIWFFLLISRCNTYLIRDKTIENEYNQYKMSVISKITLVVSFILMWLVAGLRVNVGTDYGSYSYLFSRYLELSWFEIPGIEPMFFYFNKIIGSFTDNPQWLFIFSAALIYMNYYSLIIEESRYFELSIYLFIIFGFYTSSFNILRQWIASSIIFYGYRYIFNHEKKKFLLFTLIATLFHYSAIIMLILYFFIAKTTKNKTRILIVIVSSMSILFINNIFNFMAKLITVLGLPYKYLSYVNKFGLNNARFFIFPIICLTLYLIYIFNKDRFKKVNSNIEYHINILILAYAFSIIGQRIYTFMRLQYYFLPIVTIIIPNYVLCFKKKDRSIIYSIVIFLGILFFLYTLKQNGGEPLPYYSIFSK